MIALKISLLQPEPFARAARAAIVSAQRARGCIVSTWLGEALTADSDFLFGPNYIGIRGCFELNLSANMFYRAMIYFHFGAYRPGYYTNFFGPS